MVTVKNKVEENSIYQTKRQKYQILVHIWHFEAELLIFEYCKNASDGFISWLKVYLQCTMMGHERPL